MRDELLDEVPEHFVGTLFVEAALAKPSEIVAATVMNALCWMSAWKSLSLKSMKRIAARLYLMPNRATQFRVGRGLPTGELFGWLDLLALGGAGHLRPVEIQHTVERGAIGPGTRFTARTGARRAACAATNRGHD